MPLFRRRPQVDPTEVDAIRSELVRLRADLDHDRDVRRREQELTGSTTNGHGESLPPPAPGMSLDEVCDRLGTRIDRLALELTHQIDELAGEIDTIGVRSTAAAAVTPEAFDELRAAQVRLANEQARYEIAFRHDLALLADDLRRSRA